MYISHVLQLLLSFIRKCNPRYIGARRSFSNQIVDSTTQGLPYEYSSIMHYDSKMFSENGEATILPKVPNATMGTSRRPTQLDYLHINLLYCDGKEILLNTSVNIMYQDGSTLSRLSP